MGRERHEFHERDVNRFSYEDRERWHGGRWNQSCMGGRCGWWWFAGGQWYFYAQPIYPYPLFVSEITYYEPVVVVAPPPPAYVAPPPPPPPPAVYAQPPPQFYYYCDNPPGYYPQVPTCPTRFRTVPR